MTDNNSPLVSVVIPVKNGAYWLHDLLSQLQRQTLAAKSEIIVIDSGSTDSSREIIRKFPVRLLTIPSSQFNHGETRNLGAHEAKGKYVVMTVQDAIPASDHWLANLLEGFTDDEVAGVCGTQAVPHHADKNPVQWYRPVSAPQKKRIQFKNSREYDALTPAEKVNSCRWDNVTACYRRDVLQQIPFQKTFFAEDALWAQDALRAGYAIVYNGSAVVYHYHHEDFSFAFRRFLTVLYYRYKYFAHAPAKVEDSIYRRLQILKILLTSDVNLNEKLKWWKYNRQLQRAYKKAYDTFKDALAKGDDYLDKVYEEICKTPPMHVALGK
jgi:rhamnosyltransferase